MSDIIKSNGPREEVNHPKRYADHCSLECIDVMRVLSGSEYVAAFCLGNAFKYMWRYKEKNGKEDLAKAKWYLDYVGDMGAASISKQISIMYEKLNMLYSIIMKKEGWSI